MKNIIRQRQRINCVRHFLFFAYVDDPNAGFFFDCDESGNVLRDELPEPALRNLELCESGALNMKPPVIKESRWSYTKPAILRCNCGCEVELQSDTSTCFGCSVEYNMSGQELAARKQWEYESFYE